MIDDTGADDHETERRAIRKRAMDMLARREHAPAELAAKLRRREHAEADIECVLDALVDDGLLSATRYAHAVVSSKSARGIGPVRIRADLGAAGVDEALIDEALALAEIDWVAQAEAARRKRFGASMPVDYPARAKQMRFLQRRGFDFDAINAALGGDD